MGVLLTTAIVFGIIAALVELRIVFKTPFLKRLIEKFSVLRVVFSVILALSLGALFGAGGMIIMMATLIGICVTQPVYSVAAKVKSTGHDVAQTVNQVKGIIRPFANMFKFAFAIMALPFKIVFAIIKFFDRHTSPRTA